MHVLCAQHQVLWKIKIQLNMAHGFQKFTISISELQSEILNYNLSPKDTREMSAHIHQKAYTRMFIAFLVIIVKNWK